MVKPRLYQQIGKCSFETHEYLRRKEGEPEALYWHDVMGIDNKLPFGISKLEDGTELRMFKRWVYWKVRFLRWCRK